ncbi:MAG: tetratricopeptide repeat protein [Desulfohalobiaceae bacterium]
MDPQKYLEFLQKDPQAEKRVSQFILGRSYLLGLFHQQDQKQGLELLEEAAENGYVPAMLFLGQTFEQGLAGLERDYVRAQQWYSQAAEQGSEPAQLKLENLQAGGSEQAFSLFGIVLNQADRFAMRYALQKQGASPLRMDKASSCDLYFSHGLLPGSDQLQACYTEDGHLAHVEYRFPPSPPEEQGILQDVHQKLNREYGEPEEIVQEQGVPTIYRWKQHGVQIEFWQEGQSQTVFLRYSLPEKQKQLTQEMEQEAEAQQEPEIDPENL